MSERRLLVIAEAGVNHNGDLELAKKMARVAADAGADYVKFQAFRAATLASASAPTAEYQRTATRADDQQSLLNNLELKLDDFASLADECRSAGVGFMATPFETEMAAPLIAMGMDRIKIPSGDLTNEPMLDELARLGLPMIVSTGMATEDEVRQSLAVLHRAGAADVTLLHCTSLYPAPIASINLRAMETLRDVFGIPVGYSDHSVGDHIAIAAVALGACVVEKHFTLDRTMPGPDHAASIEPDELREMIHRLRETAQALGDGIKRPASGEENVASLVRRSWHARSDLVAGALLDVNDVVLKRPGTGLSADTSPVGRRLATAVAADSAIHENDLEPVG